MSPNESPSTRASESRTQRRAHAATHVPRAVQIALCAPLDGLRVALDPLGLAYLETIGRDVDTLRVMQTRDADITARAEES